MRQNSSDSQILTRLREIVAVVYDQPELLAELSFDWWPPALKIVTLDEDLPAFAVMPETPEEIAAVLALTTACGRNVIIRGGGSGLTGAIRPIPGAILIDTRGLNVIGAVNEFDGTVQVSAGVTGGELENRLNELGFTLRHYPQSLRLSTVGGWIATGASGAFATKFGGIEQMLVGLEAVLPDGTIVSDSELETGACEPVWAQRLLRSAGTEGVITSAMLRVYPAPETIRYRAFSMPTMRAATGAIRKVIEEGILPTALCLYDRKSTSRRAKRLAVKHADVLLISGVEGAASIVNAEAESLRSAFEGAGGRDLGERPAKEWLAELLTFSCSWWVDGNEPQGEMADRIDVSASWSTLDEVIAGGREALERVSAEVRVQVAHAYLTGATVEFTFFIRKSSDEEALASYRAAWDLLASAVSKTGGEISRPGTVSGFAHGPRELLLRALDPDGRTASGSPHS